MNKRPYFKIEYDDNRDPLVVRESPKAEIRWENHFGMPITKANNKVNPDATASMGYYLIYASTDGFSADEGTFEAWASIVANAGPCNADGSELVADDKVETDPLAPTPALGS